jgi:hypothetical protein
MVPLFLGLVSVALVASNKEGRAVAEHLRPEVDAGLLTPGDVELLSSLRGRRRQLKAAKRDGRESRRAMKAFQLAASQLAFARQRAARGVSATVVGQPAAEAEFVAALNALGARLGPSVQAVRAQAEQQMAWRAAYARSVAAQAALPPPGWHPDPWGAARLRWWDGRAWSGHVAP